MIDQRHFVVFHSLKKEKGSIKTGRPKGKKEREERGEGRERGEGQREGERETE